MQDKNFRANAPWFIIKLQVGMGNGWYWISTFCSLLYMYMYIYIYFHEQYIQYIHAYNNTYMDTTLQKSRKNEIAIFNYAGQLLFLKIFLYELFGIKVWGRRKLEVDFSGCVEKALQALYKATIRSNLLLTYNCVERLTAAVIQWWGKRNYVLALN